MSTDPESPRRSALYETLSLTSPYFPQVYLMIKQRQVVEKYSKPVASACQGIRLLELRKEELEALKASALSEETSLSERLATVRAQKDRDVQIRQALESEVLEVGNAIRRGSAAATTETGALIEQVRKMNEQIRVRVTVIQDYLSRLVVTSELQNEYARGIKKVERFSEDLRFQYDFAREWLDEEKERLSRSVVDLVLEWKRNKSEE